MPKPGLWTASDWTAIAACGTFAIAVLAAVFSYRQVVQARKLREERARPYVVVDLQSSPAWQNIIDLVVENIGKTIARDVRIEFSPPLKSSQTKDAYNLADSTLVKDGIPMLPPGRRVRAMFDLSHDRLKADLPMQYTATVRCKDVYGRPLEPLTYVLDLGIGYGVRTAAIYGVHDAAKALKEIEQQLKQWNDSGGLLVWARDGDRRATEEAAWFEEQREQLREDQEPGTQSDQGA